MSELLDKAVSVSTYPMTLLVIGSVFLFVGVFGQKFKYKDYEGPALRNVGLRICCCVIGGCLMLVSGYGWYISTVQGPSPISDSQNKHVSPTPSINGRMLYTAANFEVFPYAAQAQFIPAWEGSISFHIRAELSSITQDAPDYLQFEGVTALQNANLSDFESLTAEGRGLNALAVSSTLIQPLGGGTPSDGYQASTEFLSMYKLPDGQQISFPLIKDTEPAGSFSAGTMMNSLSDTWGYYVLIALASKCFAKPPTEKCDSKKLQQVLINARSHLGPDDVFLSSEFSKLIRLTSR